MPEAPNEPEWDARLLTDNKIRVFDEKARHFESVQSRRAIPTI